MTAPAERAPAPTADALFLLGSYDVTWIFYEDGEEASRAPAVAVTTFMNRGYGYMERLFCPDFDGEDHERHTLTFLAWSPATELWNWGVADSWRENIALYTDGEDDGGFVFETVGRPDGAGPLVHRTLVLSSASSEGHTLEAREAALGDEPRLVWERRYQRRDDVPKSLRGEGFGEAAPDLPAEAHQFDFLLGEWNESHDLTFPSGQRAQWPAHGSAVRILGGHAILEHGWYDVDSQNPDAATSIVRIYNRAMRRWESMYSSNRGNSVLHFGGVMEDDRIVLHKFHTDRSRSPINYWVFHDVRQDSYGWYGHSSTDRGRTFTKTWIIKGTRVAGP